MSKNLTRKGFVAGGIATAGGLVIGGSPTVAAPVPTPKKVRISDSQDVRVLNFFLVVEEVLAGFYASALEAGGLHGEMGQFAQVALAHERKHVKWLRKLLGARARAKPSLDLGGAPRNAQSFVQNAIALEEANVAAYNGQASNLSRSGLVVAARMVSVDARHAAWIHDLAGMTPAPMTIDKPMSEAEVLRVLKRTGYLAS